jgi:hypothetical protein
MKKSIIIALISIALYACNKEKPFSRKLMKGDIWTVESVVIDGIENDIKGSWVVTQDVNIYDSVPQINWRKGSNDAFFEWQFQEKGKKFVINYQQQCAECNGSDLDTLDYLTFNLTGSYDVVKHKRKEMVFTSSSLAAYPGKEVEIQLTRK